MLKHRTLLRRLWRRTPDRPERLIVRWVDRNSDLNDRVEKSEQDKSSSEPPKPGTEPRPPSRG